MLSIFIATLNYLQLVSYIMQPKISIIIPVYNVATFLSRCIDSVLAQTFSDWELILVDDGSPDSCGDICDNYAMKDKRIRVFHKPNGGVSSARNYGLDVASGDYICFVDADDTIDNNYLNDLITNSDADLVMCGFRSSMGVHYLPKAEYISEDSLRERASEIVRSKAIYVPWIKLLKRSIIEEHQLRFDTKLRLGEDTTFVYLYLSFCKSVRFVSNESYYYEGVFGGGKKYILSYAEIDYLNHCNVSAIRAINTRLKSDIDDTIYGAKWYLLKGAYKLYTDNDAWQMYRRHHNDVSKEKYFQSIKSNCLYTALCEVKDIYKDGNFSEGYEMINDLSKFFTMPSNKVWVGGILNKLIYKLIQNKMLTIVNLYLKSLRMLVIIKRKL